MSEGVIMPDPMAEDSLEEIQRPVILWLSHDIPEETTELHMITNGQWKKLYVRLSAYTTNKIIDVLEYLSEQAIEYGITDAERYAWQHKGEADRMMIPLKAVTEALNHRKDK